MLITIEGCDGAGKSAVADAVARELVCHVQSFPNDAGVTGPAIRAYLRKEWFIPRMDRSWPVVTAEDKLLGALAFQALQVTNRMEVMEQLERAADHETNLVLCRYWQSAWVYGQLDGLSEEFLRDVHSTMAKERYAILLDVPANIAMARRAARDGALPPERYEGKLDFAEKVRKLYHKLWVIEGIDNSKVWHIVDASQPLDKVIDDVLAIVGEK